MTATRSSELVQRLRNLHAHSGDPDTVEEAADVLSNYEEVCGEHIASIAKLSMALTQARAHIDRLEELCRQQAADIRQMSGVQGPMTDRQVMRILKTIEEVQP